MWLILRGQVTYIMLLTIGCYYNVTWSHVKPQGHSNVNLYGCVSLEHVNVLCFATLLSAAPKTWCQYIVKISLKMNVRWKQNGDRFHKIVENQMMKAQNLLSPMTHWNSFSRFKMHVVPPENTGSLHVSLGVIRNCEIKPYCSVASLILCRSRSVAFTELL